ncbi:MAG: protein kinase [Myxococcales bacterium]|nr:protein kinase [Myxococcales bacterium]
MTLASGERLGPYEIIGQLGAGSMGVVYRARDTRLGRDVAVKVLTEAVAGDGDLVRRFEVEARAAGVLSHPNIVAIHDVGEHAQLPYLVSELLEGQSLREELQPGKPLPPRKVIEYGLQITQGLAAAHVKGIVHRDLKPENLFVTRDGRLKILDFGLARLIEPVGGPAHSASTIRNLKLDGTTPGTVLGTVGYMAPEQVRGQPADHRSDIFAAGAILYEMLAGRRAFEGQSGVDVMAAILSDKPPPLPRDVPAGLERAVWRCLEKVPEERFQSARDLAFQLEELSHATPALVREPSPALSAALWALLALAGVAAIATYFVGRQTAASRQPAYHQLTFRRGTVSTARLAADGQSAVYAAAWQGSPQEVFVTTPRSPESRRLELPPADLLALSSKGEMAVLLRRRQIDGEPAGTLAQASLSGGPPRELAEDVEAADWSPDGGSMLLVRRAQGQSQLEFPAGRILYKTYGTIADPRVSRDGKRVAFVDRPRRGDEAGAIALVENGAVRKLTEVWPAANGLAWSPSGAEIWFTAAEPGSAPALRAVTLSGEQRMVARVTGRMALHDVAPSGQVLLARESARAGLMVGTSGEERDLAWFDSSLLSDLSGDGKAVLFVESGGEATTHAVFLRKTDGSPAVRLGEGLLGKLSPDGKTALVLPADGSAQLTLLPTGAGDSTSLPLGGLTVSWAQFFPDGKELLVAGREQNYGPRLYRLSIQVTEGAALRPLTPDGLPLAPAAVSSDGKRVAALDPERHVTIFEDGTAKPVAGAEADEVPIRFVGDALFIFRPGELPARVRRCAQGRCEPFRELAPADPAGVTGIFAALLTADAHGYAYGYRRVLSDLYQVDGLR